MKILSVLFSIVGFLSLIFGFASTVSAVWSEDTARWIVTAVLLFVSSFFWFAFSVAAKNYAHRSGSK
jgi:hypothetical protein